MKIIGILTSAVVALFYSAVMNGWALTKLWAWFVVPLVPLPLLNVPQAIGLALLVGYMTHPDPKSDKDEDSYGWVLAKAVAMATFKPLFALGCGAIIRAFL